MKVEDVINNRDAMQIARAGFALHDQGLLSDTLTAPRRDLSLHHTFGSSTAFATSLRTPLRPGPDNSPTPAE